MLTANMANVEQGENIAFTFSTTAANVNSSNWIGIYPVGHTPGNGSSSTWQYVAAEGGVTSLSTSSLSPGTYVAYYCYNGGYTVLAGPATFVVNP